MLFGPDLTSGAVIVAQCVHSGKAKHFIIFGGERNMGQLEQGRKLDEFWDEAEGFHLQRMIAPNKSGIIFGSLRSPKQSLLLHSQSFRAS